MKYVKTLLIIFLLLTINVAEAQVLKSRIAKVGYSSDFMPFQEDGYYSVHLDLENSTQNNFVSNEIGAGFLRNGSDLYYLKFDYKFYPISALLHNFKYQIFYLSVGPGVYYEDISKSKNSYGLGIFTTGGVQVLISNRISLAFELEMNFVSNISTETSNAGSDNRHFSNSIKVGYVFNRKSKRP